MSGGGITMGMAWRTLKTVVDERYGLAGKYNLAGHLPVHADIPALEAFFVEENVNPLGIKAWVKSACWCCSSGQRRLPRAEAISQSANHAGQASKIDTQRTIEQFTRNLACARLKKWVELTSYE